MSETRTMKVRAVIKPLPRHRGGESEVVTAYDARDVDPLVKCARIVLKQHLRRGHPTTASNGLEEALAPFLQGGGE